MVICRSKFNSFTSVSLYSGRFTSVYLSCNCCPSHHTHLHSHVHTHIRTRTFSYHLGVAFIYLRLFHRVLTDASDLPGMCWVKVCASNFHGIVLPRYGSTMFRKFGPVFQTKRVRLVSPVSRLYIRGLPNRHLQGTLELLLHHQSQGTLELLWLTLRKPDVSGMLREGHETT